MIIGIENETEFNYSREWPRLRKVDFRLLYFLLFVYHQKMFNILQYKTLMKMIRFYDKRMYFYTI